MIARRAGCIVAPLLSALVFLSGCGQSPPAANQSNELSAPATTVHEPTTSEPSAETATVEVATAATDIPHDPPVAAAPPEEIVTDPALWPSAEAWPMGRGSPLATGVAVSELPDKPDLLWKFAAPDGAFETSPIIVDGTVYIGCLNGYLYALNLADGAEKWKYHSELGFYASPALKNGKLYIGDAEGKFHCVSAATGDLLWGFASQAEINSGANFHGANVLFGSQDSHLYCLDSETGKEVWRFAIDDQIRCFPTVVGDRSFVAGCDSKFHIVDLTTGTEVASVDIEAPTGAAPAVGGDFVYFGTEGETVLCINWQNPQVVWKYRDPKKRMPFRSSAALAPQLVIVGGRDKVVHALDRASGEERWRFVTKGRIDASPVIVGRRAYVGSADGRIYGLNVDSGQPEWEYEAGGGFSGGAAVAAGKLIIASEDGVVYCFGKK
jgi:outer membrane protein assembly factor BamB